MRITLALRRANVKSAALKVRWYSCLLPHLTPDLHYTNGFDPAGCRNLEEVIVASPNRLVRLGYARILVPSLYVSGSGGGIWAYAWQSDLTRA